MHGPGHGWQPLKTWQRRKTKSIKCMPTDLLGGLQGHANLRRHGNHPAITSTIFKTLDHFCFYYIRQIYQL